MSAAAKTIGVLGGMGPAATLDFFARILDLSEAKSDQDHLRVIIDCNPHLPNRNDAIAGIGPSPGPELARMAEGLARAGAEILVMPCNTAHAFLEDIKRATGLPVISMIDVTVDALCGSLPQLRIAGVLAAAGCIDAGLYQKAFAVRGIHVVVPHGPARARFMAVLYRIKAGDTSPEVRAEMRALADALIDDGAEAIVAGCSEVPLVLAPADVAAPMIDATACLALAAISAARRA